MATSAYILGRKRYQRPQALLWSNNPGSLQLIDELNPSLGSIYVPTGQEVGADNELVDGGIDQFLILSDHNRSEINITPRRIEQRQRTVNGRMRSYHVADKLEFTFSWNMLPSRAYSTISEFLGTDTIAVTDPETGQVITPAYSAGQSTLKNTQSEFTADGGAGGVEILKWYENHKGSFWMFLAYDKYSNYGDNSEAYQHLAQYNQIVEVMFSDFNYSIVKRGGNLHDLWNISVSLEEV